MKNKLAFVLLFAVCSTVFAQKNTMSKAGDSDPQATAILDKVRAKYDAYTSMEVDFSLILEDYEVDKVTQKGKLIQQGEMYYLDMEGQTIISDDKTVWVYLERINEVQVNYALSDEEAEEAGVISPKDLFLVYQKDDYVYALVNQFAEKGRLIQQIEFKPVDDDSEYSKIRLSVDKRTDEIVRIKSFNKDGSRYTVIVDKVIPNKKYSPDTFIFDETKYPGVYVEDLREP